MSLCVVLLACTQASIAAASWLAKRCRSTFGVVSRVENNSTSGSIGTNELGSNTFKLGFQDVADLLTVTEKSPWGLLIVVTALLLLAPELTGKPAVITKNGNKEDMVPNFNPNLKANRIRVSIYN